MLILLLPLAAAIYTGTQDHLVASNQTEPICNSSGECVACSFDQLRTIESCSLSGYTTTTTCIFESEPIVYLSACPGSSWSFFIFQCVFTVLSLAALKYLHSLKRAKVELHLQKLKSIIRT
mmetsp:Transcript_19719/g.36335  ORF Transcript_19719/g.36335 Transcript_19719/m.36335 type:complete len:121 (-) Transcript_19719:5548-5910(-)